MFQGYLLYLDSFSFSLPIYFFLVVVTTTVISSGKKKYICIFVFQGAIYIYHTEFCLHIICFTKICLHISKIYEFLEDGAGMDVFMPEF